MELTLAVHFFITAWLCLSMYTKVVLAEGNGIGPPTTYLDVIVLIDLMITGFLLSGSLIWFVIRLINLG